MSHHFPNLYLITDRHLIPDNRDFLGTLEELLKAGVRMIQLREKDLSAAELYPLAHQLRHLTYRYNCLLLINDRIDLALAIDADGVHLGHHSLPIHVARQILGKHQIIGASTHSLQEVKTAQSQGADFITYGPVYFTPSKARYGKPLGTESLQQLCQSCRLPVYALGGIGLDNARATMQTGILGISVISALMAASSPNQACHKLLSEIRKEV